MLKGLEGSVAPRPAAVPVKAEISRDDSQPSDEARSSCKLELQKPSKAIAGQLLANMEVTIRRCVFVGCTGSCRLIQDGTVRFQESCPRIARIRGPKCIQQHCNVPIAHSCLHQGRSPPHLTGG